MSNQAEIQVDPQTAIPASMAAIHAGMQTSDIPRTSSRYTDADRINAIGHYLVLGNLRKVEAATGIPNETLSGWTRTEWWNQLLAQIRAERNQDLDCRLSNAVDKALDGLLDRIDNGDTVVVDDELRKIPVKGRDLAVMFGVMFDKRQLLRLSPTSIQANGQVDSLAGRLVGLLERAVTKPEIDVTPKAERVSALNPTK